MTYTYDAAGEHLTGYTDQYGSHTYTYVTGQGAAREHALASVNFSDDTHVSSPTTPAAGSSARSATADRSG